MRNVCTVESCDELVNGHGLCNRHYKRWRIHGDPLGRVRTRMDELVDTYRLPVAHEPGWVGAVGANGYGRLTHDKQWLSVIDVACTLAHGPRPPEHQVLHACRNRKCYWSEHLRWGTCAENSRDRYADGTAHNGPRKITPEMAIDIRGVYASGDLTMKQLGLKYGVSASAIWRAVHAASGRQSSSARL